MTDKRKILFVDDEPNVLSGLKRMLRVLRKEMDMFFCESGAEALELMDDNHFDVIISDMRMPFMDGATLLSAVKKRSPHTIRIVLSGEADAEAICRTVGVAHQYLSKPCDSNLLIGIIKRARDLHEILSDGSIKNIVSNIDALPPMPELYAKVQDALKDPNITSDEIGAIIEQDIAMTAKILQFVNSSFFGLFQKVDTPSRAVKLLGIDTVKVLVLGLKVFDEIKIHSNILSPQVMWSHSFVTANCAKLIAKKVFENSERINNCFIGGLLHNIGKLIMISKLGEKYAKVCEMAREEQKDMADCEKEVFGTTHADIGAYLVGLWGFNSDILESVAFQGKLDHYNSTEFSPALAVHLANVASCRIMECNNLGYHDEPNWQYIRAIGLESEAKNWLALCHDYLEEQNSVDE